MGFLIDTSIFVAWERVELEATAIRTLAGDEPLALSVITASELLHGVHRADTALRRGRREKFVEGVLAALPLLPIDIEVSRQHARIWADLRTRGEMIGAHDLLIAATALTHDMTIATRNERDFRRIEDVRVVRW